MAENQIIDIARALHQARLEAHELAPWGERGEGFSLETAYGVQAEGIRLRTEIGEKVTGMKMGLTSEAKRKQMNLDKPIYGVLTDRMKVEHRGTIKLEGTIHPKIEPEIAFWVTKEIRGIITYEEARDVCESAHAALEILDSRYKGFKYFSLPDVVADNSSSSHYVIGPGNNNWKTLDIGNLTMRMSVNGKIAQEARSDAISGDPLMSVIQLSELLAQNGKILPEGSWVMTGAAATAMPLEPGMTVDLTIEGLERVEVRT